MNAESELFEGIAPGPEPEGGAPCPAAAPVDPTAWIYTFAYRADQFFGQFPGEPHPVPVRRPLRGDDVVRGLDGTGPTISVLFIRDDSTAKVGAVDADAEDGWKTIHDIAAALDDNGIRCAVEQSHRGGHLWVVSSEPLPAFVIRRALMVAILLAGHDSSDPKIEVRPSTDEKRSPFGGGSLRGPMMPHPATGIGYPLLDPMTDRPLASMPLADGVLAARLAAAWRRPAEAPRPARRPYNGPSKVAAYNAAVSIWDVLNRYFPGLLRGQFAREARCPFHDDRHASLSIYANGTKVKCHAAGCVLANRGPETAYGLAVLCKEAGR
jgi:hypothetical protein